VRWRRSIRSLEAQKTHTAQLPAGTVRSP